MKQPLTKTQYETLDFIKRYYKKNKYFPSFEEIRKNFRLVSLDSVWERLNHLEKKGWIKRKKHHARWIKIL